jgi:hypothetical protein
MQQSYAAFKKSVEDHVLSEAVSRIIKKQPFRMEVTFGGEHVDFADVTFTPIQVPPSP